MPPCAAAGMARRPCRLSHVCYTMRSDNAELDAHSLRDRSVPTGLVGGLRLNALGKLNGAQEWPPS